MDKLLPGFKALMSASGEGSSTRFRWVFGQAKTLSLPEQIAANVGDRILAGELAGGEWLREQDLADEFEVSRSPIREAMRILEHEGLVDIHLRRGAQVSMLSAGQLANIAEVRVALLKVVARRLAQQQDPAVIQVLEEGMECLGGLVDDPSAGNQYAELLSRLTMYCAAACGNEKLFSTIVSLSLQMSRYTRIGLARPERRRRSYQLWLESLEAFRKGDVDRAEALWELRLVENSEEITKLLSADAAR